MNMILLNNIGIPFAKYFDNRSLQNRTERGIPLLCEVIPSILSVLLHKVVLGNQVPGFSFVPFSASFANKEIIAAFKDGGLPKAQQVIQKLKLGLEKNTRFNCLAHQFVISMDQIISVALVNDSVQAEQLAWDIIRATLLELKVLSKVDQLSAPLQALGVPILCSEVPFLPDFF